MSSWVRDEAGPRVAKLGSALTSIENYDSFECRGRNRVFGAKLSEHGKGNAIDVRALHLADGRRIELTDVNADKPLREDLRDSVCHRFTTVLGPGADRYHEGHIHLDIESAARRLSHLPVGRARTAAANPAAASAPGAGRCPLIIPGNYEAWTIVGSQFQASCCAMTIGSPSELMRSQPAAHGLTRRGLIKGGLGLTALGGLVMPSTAAYAAHEAAHDLIVTRYAPVPPNWPAGKRLSITVIADLHAGGPNMGAARVAQVVDGANALGSDLVVVLGDFFATHRFVTEKVPHAVWAAELARLKAPLGVHAILGNHDWWYDVDGVRNALAKVRIPLMENNAVLLGEAGNRFWLAGLGDQLALVRGPGQFEGVDDLPGTLETRHHQRPGDPAGARARYFHESAGQRRAHACRPHPWRPDRAAVRAAALGAVGIWRALCLWPHRRARPPHDRVGRARLLQGAAAPGRAAGNPAHRSRRLKTKTAPVSGRRLVSENQP